MTDHPSGSIIAVVDDDQRILESLEILLESADHAVRLFASGAALLESGCLAHIDCVISDIDMPEIDGFELLRAVHAARPGLPIILITGHPEILNRLPPIGAQALPLVHEAVRWAGTAHGCERRPAKSRVPRYTLSMTRRT